MIPWKYVLEGKTPVPVDDIHEWAMKFETCDRQIKLSELPSGETISTVFLGVDSNFLFGTQPLLFETMIFGGEYDHWQQKYATWEEAEAGHEEAIQMIFDIIPDKV